MKMEFVVRCRNLRYGLCQAVHTVKDHLCRASIVRAVGTTRAGTTESTVHLGQSAVCPSSVHSRIADSGNFLKQQKHAHLLGRRLLFLKLSRCFSSSLMRTFSPCSTLVFLRFPRSARSEASAHNTPTTSRSVHRGRRMTPRGLLEARTQG
jgi:hypothetical protein